MKLALGGRVRFCVTGGAPISKETLQFVQCALGSVVQGYGATETCAVSSLTMTFDTTVGHVGPPSGSVAVRLVDVRRDELLQRPRRRVQRQVKSCVRLGQKQERWGGVDWRLIRNGWVLRSFCQRAQTWPPHQWYEKEDGRGFLQGRQLELVQDG